MPAHKHYSIKKIKKNQNYGSGRDWIDLLRFSAKDLQALVVCFENFSDGITVLIKTILIPFTWRLQRCANKNKRDREGSFHLFGGPINNDYADVFVTANKISK